MVDLQNRLPAALVILRALTLASGLTLAVCGTAGAQEQQQLPAVNACFVTAEYSYPVVLEVASEPLERRIGLMGRKHLPENAGMLFKYQKPRPSTHGFWMYQTLIPLDIAYLGPKGEIVSLRQMHPCASSRSSDCPAYPAGKPFLSAVEMNAGYFHERGIGTGDRLVWPANGACKP